jgi:hypothetical protein
MTLLSKISNTTSLFAKRLNGDYKTWMMAEISREQVEKRMSRWIGK